MEIPAGGISPLKFAHFFSDVSLSALYFISEWFPPCLALALFAAFTATGSPSFFKLGLNKAEHFLNWTRNRRLSTQQREDFCVVLLRLKVLVMVNASFPITVISSEANGICPLYFMFIDIYFRAESTFRFFFSQSEVTGSQKSFSSKE